MSDQRAIWVQACRGDLSCCWVYVHAAVSYVNFCLKHVRLVVGIHLSQFSAPIDMNIICFIVSASCLLQYIFFIIKINIEHYQAYHLTAQWAYLSVFLSLPHFDVVVFFLSECFRAKGVESFSSSVPSIPNPFPELSKSPVLISSFPPQSSDKHVSVLPNQLIQRSKVTL